MKEYSPVIIHILPIFIGFILDLIVGDPPRFPHIVRLFGGIIEKGEKALRKLGKEQNNMLFFLGMFLSLSLVTGTFLFFFVLLNIIKQISMTAYIIISSLLCYEVLATKSLKVESMKVYKEIREQNLEKAREKLSRIVGRDTKALDYDGITKAVVETIGENTADGVIAPMLYLFVGGAPLGLCYKAINTLDSMIGYKNDKYLYFGKFAARLDDAANFLPARISAALLIAAAVFTGDNIKNGVKVFLRDRFKHKSPNSAQTEAVVAGLLGVQLAGDAYYGGILTAKPTIGDDLRPIDCDDIIKTNRLMYGAAITGMFIFTVVYFLIKGALNA